MVEGNRLLTFFNILCVARVIAEPSSHGKKPQHDGICHSSVELCGMLWTTGHVFILIDVDISEFILFSQAFILL